MEMTRAALVGTMRRRCRRIDATSYYEVRRSEEAWTFSEYAIDWDKVKRGKKSQYVKDDDGLIKILVEGGTEGVEVKSSDDVVTKEGALRELGDGCNP